MDRVVIPKVNVLSEYFVLLRPYNQDDEWGLTSIPEFDSKYYEAYALCFERAPKTHAKHYHLIIRTKETKDNLRAYLKKCTMNMMLISFKKEHVQSFVRSVAYTMKNGDWRYNGLDVNEFLMAKKVSFEKPKKAIELKRDIYRDCIEHKITFEEAIRRYCSLPTQHFQMFQAQSWALKLRMELDGKFKKTVVERVMEYVGSFLEYEKACEYYSEEVRNRKYGTTEDTETDDLDVE